MVQRVQNARGKDLTYKKKIGATSKNINSGLTGLRRNVEIEIEIGLASLRPDCGQQQAALLAAIFFNNVSALFPESITVTGISRQHFFSK